MPELAEWNQSLLTQRVDPCDRDLRSWGASEVLTRWPSRGKISGHTSADPSRVVVRVSSPAPPDPIVNVIRKASELVHLPPGWNSYGAKPVANEAVEAAITFLVEAIPTRPNVVAPAVVPTVRGGLQLEWHRRGVDLEIEFGPDASGSWYAEDRETKETVEQPLLNEDVVLRQWLVRVSG